MRRHASIDAERLAAEGQAQALRHAKDAVDRSAWLLAVLRREMVGEPGAGSLRRLELRCALAEIERRQAGLSAAYDNLAATPFPGKNKALSAFVLAYDEFLSAVGAARMESRNGGVFCTVSKQSA